LWRAGSTHRRKTFADPAVKFAAERRSPEVIQRLIDAGASVDGPKGTRQTALVLAARANNVENVKVLIDSGADLLRKCTLPWAQGSTAAGVAEMEGRKRAAEYLRGIEASRKKARKE
jgi:ankyrin repeat protein